MEQKHYVGKEEKIQMHLMFGATIREINDGLGKR